VTMRGAPPPMIAGAGLTANEAGALAYTLGALTGIIFLVVEPYRSDRLVRFHAYQSLFFFALWSGAAIVWTVSRRILTSVLLARLSLLAGGVVLVSGFFYWIFVLYKAYANERYEIPLLGALSARLAG